MAFLYPAFLFALAALAIPIVIHLFNFRRYKTVYFSNTSYLREVKEQTDSRSRLKHLLVLISRILTICFLVFAFAQPYLRRNTDVALTGKKSVSIYIDNTFSMGQTSGDVPLLEIAKARAGEIVAASGNDDQFQLLTAGFEGRHQRLVDKAEMIHLLQEVQLTAVSRNLTDIMLRQADALGTSDGLKQAYLFSDFQESFSRLGGFAPDTTVQWNFIPVQSREASNVFIDSCWFNSPVQIANQSATLMVRLRNLSGKPVENGRITLKINDQIKAISEFRADAFGYASDTLTFNITETGWNRAELSITDHPISFDDSYYLSFPVADHLNAMVLYETAENQFLHALLSGNTLFTYRAMDVSRINYAEIGSQDFVILDGLASISSGLTAQLKAFVEEGGNLAVFPATGLRPESYNEFFSALQADAIVSFQSRPVQVTIVNTDDPVFEDVFQRISQNISLPRANGLFRFAHQTRSVFQTLLTTGDGAPFLLKYVLGKGLLYVSAVPLDKNVTDLPLSPVFAPMVYNMAITRWQSSNNTFIIGKPGTAEADIPGSGADQVLRLRSADTELIPAQRMVGNRVMIYFDGNISQAGFYSLLDPEGQLQAVYATNFDRRESDLSLLESGQLEEMGRPLSIRVFDGTDSDLAGRVSAQRLGIPLWKVSVILALLFIALEIALLKLWK